MPTIGWKLRQMQGWMSLSHESKGPPFARKRTCATITTIREWSETSRWKAVTNGNNPRLASLEEAGQPPTCTTRVPLQMTVTSTIILASKPNNRPSTILKAYKYMPPPSFQNTENWSKSKVKRTAAQISLENRKRGEVRVQRGAGVSAPLQLCISKEWSFGLSNFLLFHRKYCSLSFTLLVLEYLISLVVGSLDGVSSKFYLFVCALYSDTPASIRLRIYSNRLRNANKYHDQVENLHQPLVQTLSF
jgi:hypothetical protein